jgi:8-oxo-dGTP diphosphatase
MPTTESNILKVGLGLVHRRDHWLVTRRAPGRIFAGFWEFPGGKLRTGESAPDGVIREIREEVGLSVIHTEELDVLTDEHGGKTVWLHLVLCICEGEPVLADPAVDQVRWVTLAELETLPMPPANGKIIEILKRLPA